MSRQYVIRILTTTTLGVSPSDSSKWLLRLQQLQYVLSGQLWYGSTYVCT